MQIQLTENQCKQSIYYIGNYMSKSPVDVGNLLSIVHACIQENKEHPSTAVDSGTEKRTAQYLVTKILNKLSSTIELSDQQVLLAL